MDLNFEEPMPPPPSAEEPVEASAAPEPPLDQDDKITELFDVIADYLRLIDERLTKAERSQPQTFASAFSDVARQVLVAKDQENTRRSEEHFALQRLLIETQRNEIEYLRDQVRALQMLLNQPVVLRTPPPDRLPGGVFG